MRIIVSLSFLTLAACAGNPNDECGNKFALPKFSTETGVRFEEVQLRTLGSPYRLKGAAAEIFYEGALSDAGYGGSVAEPRLIRGAGDVCVPADTGSMLSIAAYEIFERIFDFDRGIGVEGHLKWPRKVGVELHLRNPDGQTHNNAHYFGVADSIGILPYSLDGVHLAFNPGILAHEHFHAHFQSQVLNPLNAVSEIISSGGGIKPTVDDLDNADLQSPSGLNRFVLRAWNEGLADFYACVFTGEPDFFTASNLDRVSERECNGPLTLFAPGAVLKPQIAATGPGQNVNIRKEMVGIAYFQGTLAARLLYRIAGPDKAAQRQLLQHVMRQLHRVPLMVRPKLDRTIMDFEDIVPVLLDGAKLDTMDCVFLSLTLSKQTLSRRFSQCRF